MQAATPNARFSWSIGGRGVGAQGCKMMFAVPRGDVSHPRVDSMSAALEKISLVEAVREAILQSCCLWALNPDITEFQKLR